MLATLAYAQEPPTLFGTIVKKKLTDTAHATLTILTPNVATC